MGPGDPGAQSAAFARLLCRPAGMAYWARRPFASLNSHRRTVRPRKVLANTRSLAGRRVNNWCDTVGLLFLKETALASVTVTLFVEHCPWWPWPLRPWPRIVQCRRRRAYALGVRVIPQRFRGVVLSGLLRVSRDCQEPDRERLHSFHFILFQLTASFHVAGASLLSQAVRPDLALTHASESTSTWRCQESVAAICIFRPALIDQGQCYAILDRAHPASRPASICFWFRWRT